jgi:hypothetical protein
MRWALACALAAGCSYTFDGNAPDLPLLGAPPAALGPRLNGSIANSSTLLYGVDGHYWVAMGETIETAMGPRNGLHVVRLADPPKEQLIYAQEVYITGGAYYLLSPDDTKTKTVLTIRGIGDDAVGDQFTLPPGQGLLLSSGDDRVFLYWVAASTTMHFSLVRRDGSFSRQLPLPDGVDPLDPLGNGQLFFTWDGALLFVRDGKGHVVAHSSTDERDVDLGVRPKLNRLDESHHALVTCGDDGLRSVRYDGGAESVLDDAACDVHGALFFAGAFVYYGVGDDLRRVRLDGSAAPELALEKGLRVIGIGPHDEVLYSRDPADKYILGVGDGWLGSWNFMARGRAAYFSRDAKRMRWLENAARTNGSGDFISAPIGGAPLRLSRNTREYEELADGRVLADADHAFRGTQNRVVVIDEQKRVSYWVAAAAADFTHIPGTNDLLIDVVSGPEGFDVVRVPIPPPQ